MNNMPRPKKDAVPLNIRLDKTVADRLAEYCETTGQTKTTAIERLLSGALDEYYAKPKDKRVPQ